MATQRISFDPDPPIAGKAVLICYQFDRSGIVSTTLTVTFRPGGTQQTLEVTKGAPCKSIEVPLGTTQILVEDNSGTSPDRISPVL